LSLRNPRFKQTVPIDDYVLDVLMRDLIGHDQKPSAYLVYLHLYAEAARTNGAPSVLVCARSRTSPGFPKAPFMRRSRI
jgi:hypothetical protein